MELVLFFWFKSFNVENTPVNVYIYDICLYPPNLIDSCNGVTDFYYNIYKYDHSTKTCVQKRYCVPEENVYNFFFTLNECKKNCEERSHMFDFTQPP